jgi:hypothetical protein
MQLLRENILSEERSIILLHHCGKHSNEARGASAISGATDCNITFNFSKAGEEDPTRHVNARGRYPTENMVVVWTEEDGYELLGEAEDGGLSDNEMRVNNLVRMIRESGFEGMSTKDVVTGALSSPSFKGRSEKTVANMLSKAVSKGLVQKVRNGNSFHYFVEGLHDLKGLLDE